MLSLLIPSPPPWPTRSGGVWQQVIDETNKLKYYHAENGLQAINSWAMEQKAQAGEEA